MAKILKLNVLIIREEDTNGKFESYLNEVLAKIPEENDIVATTRISFTSDRYGMQTANIKYYTSLL